VNQSKGAIWADSRNGYPNISIGVRSKTYKPYYSSSTKDAKADANFNSSGSYESNSSSSSNNNNNTHNDSFPSSSSMQRNVDKDNVKSLFLYSPYWDYILF
jgi:hypothetical protein